MTGMMHEVYKETYKGYAIEIVEHSHCAPGGYGGGSWYLIWVDSLPISGNFDHCPGPSLAERDNPDIPRKRLPSPEQSEALAAARAYCDGEIEALEKRGDESLTLTLSYREARILQRACYFATLNQQIPSQDFQKCYEFRQRIEALLNKLNQPQKLNENEPDRIQQLTRKNNFSVGL